MKMFDATLALAREICEHYSGSVTSATTTSLTDSTMQHQAGLFNNGTVWITSGAQQGSFRKVLSYGNGAVSWSAALGGAPSANDLFTIADQKFPLHLLRQAINTILLDYPIEKVDTSLTIDIQNYDEINLPAGVSNLLTVEIASNDASPYGWVKNQTWRETGHGLDIYDGLYQSDDGKKIRLIYEGKHGVVDDTQAINPLVDSQYLTYAAEAWIWRNYVLKFKKDDPLAMDMLNEAKFLEAANKAKARSPHRMTSRPIRLAGYPGY